MFKNATAIALVLTSVTSNFSIFVLEGTAAESDSISLEEIIVTARKKPESLQDIPVSATVLNARSLELRSVTDVSDLTASVPNVSYQDRAGGHQTSIGIRGIASNVRNIGLEDSVGVYVDGVYIGRPMFYNLDLAEVQQVEVLRGPQGTLFGKNTVAGALNITTKAVSDEIEGKVQGTFGNFGLRHFKGYLSGRFSDKIGGSVSIVKKDTSGFVENLFNGEKLQAVDQFGIAAKLEINPNERLRVRITADYSEKDNDVNGSQILVPGGSFLGISWGAEPGGNFGNQFGPFVVNEDGPQKYEEEVKGVSGNLDYDLSDTMTLTVIAAWRSMDLLATFDDDNTTVSLSNSIFTDEAEQTSIELRLASTGNGSFDWILGGYYFDQNIVSDRFTEVPIFGGIRVNGRGFVDTRSLAIFASGDYHITDKLDLNAGLRYTNDAKQAFWDQDGAAAPAFGLPVVTLSGDETFDEFSPMVALTYAVNEDASIYAKFAKGFKSGGFVTDLVGLDGFVLQPETVSSYELGLKSLLADGRMRLNAAAFYMDYTNLQTLDLQGLQFIGSNAAQAQIKGFEVEVEVLASENLRFTGGVGFTDSEYNDFIRMVNGVGIDLSGNTLRNAPKWTANLLAEYSANLTDEIELTVIGEWNYKSKIFYNVANSDNTVGPAYSLFNARIIVHSDAGWGLAFWGKNIFDKEYITYLRDGPFNQQTGLFGEPATYGVDLSYEF